MAICCICGNNPGKISMTGLNGKICQDCQRNIVNIRTGKVDIAKSYFNNIDFESIKPGRETDLVFCIK